MTGIGGYAGTPIANRFIKNLKQTAYCGSSSPMAELHRSPAQDTVSIRFSGKSVFAQPTTTAESRFRNDRVSLQANHLVPSLVEKLDEIMTVTGEYYSKNEAFTTLIDLKVPSLTMPRYEGLTHEQSVEAQLSAQVDHVLNVGKAKNIGILILSSDAVARGNRDILGMARAAFNAIDPESVKAGALKPVPVAPLTLTEADTVNNAKAADWNTKMSGFYKAVATRLATKDDSQPVPTLAREVSTDTRLVNANVYVTPQMLNKKKTGHGGVAVGLAVKDMQALLKNLSPDTAVSITDLSASYQDKFVESDALQFDTTLDHVNRETGDVVLSTRIYKLDTKGQAAQGPIILVHAKAAHCSSRTQAALADGKQTRLLNALAGENKPADAAVREQEAQTWLSLRS
jgi:hypothetical protein